MNDVKQRNRRRRQRKRSQNHKRSVLAISAVVLMLTVMVSANSMTLKAKNREYQAQETELKEQIQAEHDREKEIKELEKYVGTDKYVEDVAKEKLGLVHNNEIIFKDKGTGNICKSICDTDGQICRFIAAFIQNISEYGGIQRNLVQRRN